MTDTDCRERVLDLARRTPILEHLRIEVGAVEPGYVELTVVPFPAVTQQHGYVHAGMLATLADTSAGFAAYSQFEPGDDILSIEFKINMLRPATGDRVTARARVLKPGRTITVVESEVYGIEYDAQGAVAKETLAAKATVSLIRLATKR